MSRKRFSKIRFYHRTSLLSRGVAEPESLLVHDGQGPLIFVFVIGLVVTTFGSFMRSAFAGRRHAGPDCLAFDVYFEARGEPEAGQYAVAEVTMNRVASGRYPDTVCGVVHQKNWDPLRKRYVSAFPGTTR